MIKKKTTKKGSAKKKLSKKPAAKKVAKKKTAKKQVKAKVQKKKKSAPVKAKKKTTGKPVAKKVTKKVAKAPVKKIKKSLPGYPHYSPKDDIMNPKNQAKKVTLKEDMPSKTSKKPSEDLDEKPYLSDMKTKKARNSGELTKEDQDLLGSDELNLDLDGDDAVLKNRVWPVDMAGDDLDIPGAELDDANEILGEEDEENNNYSIGGDRHDDLEENPDSGQ